MLTGSSWGRGRTRLTWIGFNWQSSFNTSADGSWDSDTLRLLFYCLQKLFEFNTGSTLTHPCLTDQSGTRFCLFLRSWVICFRQTQMRMAFEDPGALEFSAVKIPRSLCQTGLSGRLRPARSYIHTGFSRVGTRDTFKGSGSPWTPRELQILPVKM